MKGGKYGTADTMFFPTAAEFIDQENEWRALKTLQTDANVKYVVNLPLIYNQWNTTGRDLMAKARQVLGEENILGYELGNEPNACKCS